MAFKSGSGLKSFLQGQKEKSAASLIPITILFLFTLITKVPVGQWFGVVPVPALSLIVIFFWSVVDERRFPIGVLFAFGIFEDLFSGAPIGLWALIYVGMNFYVSSQRRVLAPASFTTNWISFGFVSLAAFVLIYFVLGFTSGTYPPIAVLLVPYIFTLALFPPMARFLAMLESRLARIGIGD